MTIVRLTLREAANRKVLLVGAVISVAFLMLFWLGFAVGFDQATDDPDPTATAAAGTIAILAHGVVKWAMRLVATSTATTIPTSMYTRKRCNGGCPTSGWAGESIGETTASASDIACQCTCRCCLPKLAN